MKHLVSPSRPIMAASIHLMKARLLLRVGAVATAIGSLLQYSSQAVVLQNAAATATQGGFTTSMAIDGITTGDAGWAIAFGYPNWVALAQTAVFETATDISYPGGSRLEFTLHQNYGHGFTIGCFRLSVTTDDRSLFADGSSNGGDVTANWTVLSPFSYVSSAGATMTKLGDDSILAGPPPTGADIYTVMADSFLVGITGVRLEVLEHPNLPDEGPGHGLAGNFVLTEITLDAAPIPEPGAFALIAGLGLVALCVWRRVRT